MSGGRTPETFAADLEVKVRMLDTGQIMTSLKSTGAYSGEVIDHRFYFGQHMPPEDLHPVEFWAAILGGVAGHLAADL